MEFFNFSKVGRVSGRLSFVFPVFSESLLDINHWWTLHNPLFALSLLILENIFYIHFCALKIYLYHLQAWWYQDFQSNSEEYLPIAKKQRPTNQPLRHSTNNTFSICNKLVINLIYWTCLIDSCKTRKIFFRYIYKDA